MNNLMPAAAPGTAPANPAPDAQRTRARGRTDSPRWGLLGATLTLGLGGAFLIDRLAPRPSLSHTLGCCVVGLLPAALYLTCCYNPHRRQRDTEPSANAPQEPQAPAPHPSREKFPPAAAPRAPMAEIMAFSVMSIAEQARQNRLRIPQQDAELEAIYVGAWLRNTATATFNDDDIAFIARFTMKMHSLVALVRVAREIGWSTQPLPESRICHARSCPVHAAVYKTPADVPDFAFQWVPTNAYYHPESPLPLDQLNISDVLVMTYVLTRGGEESRMLVGLQRAPRDLFIVFNPRKGLFCTNAPALLQDLLRNQLAVSQGSLRVEMMRLQYSPSHSEPDQAQGQASVHNA